MKGYCSNTFMIACVFLYRSLMRALFMNRHLMYELDEAWVYGTSQLHKWYEIWCSPRQSSLRLKDLEYYTLFSPSSQCILQPDVRKVSTFLVGYVYFNFYVQVTVHRDKFL